MRRLLPIAAALLFAALLPASAPAQDLGPELRLTNQGPDNNAKIDADFPGVAVNTKTGEALVVWAGDNTEDGQSRIYAQRIAPDGSKLGGVITVNDTVDPETVNDYNPPAVAYSEAQNEYLATWNVEDDRVFAQRIDAAGNQQGGDVLVADGFDDIETAKASFSPEASQWLVVWKGFKNADEEVWGQRLNANGSDAGGDFQISNFTRNADDAVDVAYAPELRRWLVVFIGEIAATDNKREAHGQFVDLGGNQVGPNDFRISQMGPDNNAFFDASPPQVAYNPRAQQFLVAWAGNDDRPGHTTTGESNNLQERELYVQLVNGNGDQVGEDDRLVGRIGPDGDPVYDPYGPELGYNPNADEFMLAFHGDDNSGTNVNDHFEVFAQRLKSSGEPITAKKQITDVQPNGNAEAGAHRAILSYDPTTCNFWVVYGKGDQEPGGDDFEGEIFGRRLLASPCPPKPTPQPQPQPQPQPLPVILPRPLPPVLGTSRTARRQRIGRNGAVSVVGSCAGPCTLVGTGTVSFPGAARTFRLQTARKTLTRAGRATLKLRLSRTARRAVQRALRRRKRVTARVTVAATDPVTKLVTRRTVRITGTR